MTRLRRALQRIAIAACQGLLLGLPLAAVAHKPSDAYLQLQVQGRQIEQRFDIALRDLERELALDADDDGRLAWGEVRQRWPDIERLAAAGLRLQADGQPCRPAATGSTPQLDEHSDGRYAVLVRRWTCDRPVQHLEVGYTLFSQSDPTHRGIVRVRETVAGAPATGDASAVLVPGAPAHVFTLGATGPTPGLIGFVKDGVHHILIGTDHVLFLLALLLPALLVRRAAPPGWTPAPALRPVLVDVLRVVTAFTVAHSITLALAAFDVLSPPSRWIESVIAASVVLAALNNLRPVVGHGRWKLTFAFGLVHGFGFANALKDLGLQQGALALPLFGFNLGVELGQLAIVALFLAVAWPMRASAFYRRGVLPVGSAAIALLATLWLVERVFDLTLPWPF